MKFRIAACSLAVSAAFSAGALAAPSVSFKQPSSGTTLSGNVYQSSACEAVGSAISYVRFYLDGVWLNTESTKPYLCNLDTRKFANGTHRLEARAYDGKNVGRTAAVSININNGTTGGGTTAPPPPPTSNGLTITSPAVGATLSGSVNACAASAPSGTSYVRFYRDGVWLNTDTGSPYTCNVDVSNLTTGTHMLKAISCNGLNAVTAQVEIPFSVGTVATAPQEPAPTPPPPTTTSGLTFTSPASGATLSGSINPCAAAVPTGTGYVRFYRDGVWLNTDTGAPFACNVDVSRLTTGTHMLKAIAYNGLNAITGQAEIPFNVGSVATQPAQDAAPTVSLTSPAVDAILSNTATCSATAADDVAVAKVEFLLGSTLVGTSTAAPYACSFDTKTFGNGSHAFTARATDNLGKTATAQRSVTIQNDVVADPGTGGATAIALADIVGQAQAEIPFAQQSGYNTQVLNQYINAPQIPETGMHASTLSSGETLRFGKYVDPRDSARKALAFQVDPGDVTTSGAKRAELKFANNIEMDQVYWTAMSVYVYDWGQLGSNDVALFGLQQHNGSPVDLSPNFSLITSNGGRNFYVLALGSSSTSPSYGNTVSRKYADQPIPFGRWIDFVFKFKLNTSGNGFLQVWMDGTQIVDHNGLLGYITPGYKDFFKFGYYNWSGSNFASTRKVLVRSPVIVSDPAGTKYKPEDLRAYINAH